MIKEWFYEATVNGKKYRINCTEYDGYGGSRIRTQSMTPLDEESDEETIKAVERPAKKGENVEES